MPRPPKLTDFQKEALSTLDRQFAAAINSHDFESAKAVADKIESLLAPAGHTVRIARYKNDLFELALDRGMYAYAEQGLSDNLRLTATNTQTHLRSEVLLAICYLRSNQDREAQVYIQKVLKDRTVIRNPDARKEFHRTVIDRFNEETALSSLRFHDFECSDIESTRAIPADRLCIQEHESLSHRLAEQYTENGLPGESFGRNGESEPLNDFFDRYDTDELLNVLFDRDDGHKLLHKLLHQYSEDELFAMLGHSLPAATKYRLFKMNDFARRQLPLSERKSIIAPKKNVRDEKAGKTIFQSIKKVLYKSLCDKNSEVYKAWYTNGLGTILDKKFLGTSVAVSLGNIGIGYNALIVYAVALILRFGLDVYCEHCKPSDEMGTSGK